MADLHGSEPLEWPARQARTERPIRSRFGRGYYDKPTIAAATSFLKGEIERLGASNAVVSTDLRLRQDGLPYSNQREPEDQGVAVYFDVEGQRSVIAIDRYDRIACNIYAVARTIEALRQIDRDGGPSILAAATSGFRALPESGSGEPWWEVLGVRQGDSAELVKRAHRHRCRMCHPDAGGDPERWAALQEAWRQACDVVEGLR